MEKPKVEAFRLIQKNSPKGPFRGAIVGCGRMGSTIDDEHIGMPHYPWPWAHAPAMIEARGVDLIAGVDTDPEKLKDFKRRWGVSALYKNLEEMVKQERPDIVSITTRPEPRAEITVALAELGVKAIFATKPMCRTLAEADTMIDACRNHGVIFVIACHLNWYGPYTNARKLIGEGTIGKLKSMVCHSSSNLSNIQSHSLGLFRLFAEAPAKWVFGVVDNKEQKATEGDLSGSGYIFYENGVRGILNSQSENTGLGWTLEFIGEKGRVVSRNSHAQFELWTTHPNTNNPIQCQYPYPWHLRSSMVEAIESVCRSIEGTEEEICPGKFGREMLEIVIGFRESHHQGNVRLDLPLKNRCLRMG